MSAAASASTYTRPRTLDEALAAIARHAQSGTRPVLLAGGTDFMVERHMLAPGTAPGPMPPVVDITALAELANVHRSEGKDGGVRYAIGSAVSYAVFRKHADLVREVPILGVMARDVGAVQIQARGTLGGNLATGSPAADGVPVLGALAADITLASAARGRRTVRIDEFFTGYKRTVMAADEMIVEVSFAAPGKHWMWRKVGTRLAQSIAKVALAATARVNDGVIADAHFGMASVGPTTAMLPTVRAAMLGKAPAALDGKALRAALDRDIAPIDDVRSTREYRLHVAGALLDQFAASLRA